MKITNLEQLKAIKEQGLALTYPDKIKIMVGMATCGISAGADKVYAALEKKIAELLHRLLSAGTPGGRDLPQKGQVKLPGHDPGGGRGPG